MPLALRLKHAYLRLRMLVFTSLVDLRPDLLSTDAHGFVCKEEDTDQLLAGLMAIAEGHQYSSPVADDCRRHYQQFGPESLTPGQEKILRASGL